MAITDLAAPSVRRPSLEDALRAQVGGEVRFDAGTRAAYSTDASNFREVPVGVVCPRTVDDAEAAVAVCRDHDVPVLSRGGGTSLAGQTTNTAVVLDWTKYCHRVVSVDAGALTAVVEPGIALDPLNHVLAEHGLMVGPKPATHVSCTVGGMIGNNSCGTTAQAYGTMVDSVVALEVLTYDGLRCWVGATDDATLDRVLEEGGARGDLYSGLRALRDRYGDRIRAVYPDIPRRVSGYNLDQLLPENGFHVARALVGSESTLVTVLQAELSLFPVPAERSMVVLGYDDVVAAARDVPAVVAHRPSALEGVDHQLVHLEYSEAIARDAIAELPAGSAWLMAQFSGDSRDEVDRRGRAMVDELTDRDDPPSVVSLDDPEKQEQLWEARESGLGATAYPPAGGETHPGWEDAAVPPERLAEYLADFRSLLERSGYGSAAVYGHFGQGCVHCRIPFDLLSAPGVADYRRFMVAAAELVVSYGGSLSGEHGDGQLRGELLPIMFGHELVGAFGELKALFDPRDRMNPGKVVHPRPLDEDLREGPDHRPWNPQTFFAYPDDGGSFAHAASRCVGIGKCRGDEGGVMCPSYRATREEEDSTRGRARLLFEMLEGDVITDRWRSSEVLDALDLCLACKGCRSDCPVNVDMATYKAEFLAHHYRGRLRPLAHYSMGWLPLWARLATSSALLARVINTLTGAPGVDAALKRVGGIAAERGIPVFAEQTFTRWFAGQDRRPRPTPCSRGPVVLWPDTFSNALQPEVARAALEVLTDAGFEVTVPQRPVCCGLTWISTGQLTMARRMLERTLEMLAPALRDGTPVVVLEPSCAAVFRSDLPELLRGDADARRLADLTRTLAELLHERAPDWRPPSPVRRRALVQPHCHQHAILGTGADRSVMSAAGLDAEVLDAGCCGLAGNFGFEDGHYEVSMACAEDHLLPAVRDADPDTLVLADGYSCRTQIEQSDVGRTPVHLAEVLAVGVAGNPDHPGGSLDTPARPTRPGPGARAAILAALGTVAAAGALSAAVLAADAHRRLDPTTRGEHTT